MMISFRNLNRQHFLLARFDLVLVKLQYVSVYAIHSFFNYSIPANCAITVGCSGSRLYPMDATHEANRRDATAKGTVHIKCTNLVTYTKC